jgi:predicted transcriptional regulator
MKKSMFYTFKEHKKELMKDSAFKAEYKKIEPEFKLAREIIKRRIEKKMTQGELAKKAGTRQPVISRIESGNANPRFDSLKNISEALDSKLEVRLVAK